MSQFYNYKEQKSYKELNYSCKKCDWNGTGEQADEDMGTSSGFPLLCPRCGEYIDWIDVTVSLDDLLTYGTEEDKASARQRQAFLSRVRAAELKSPDQLPDIEADEIIITLREEEKSTTDSDAYIVLLWKEKELWREVRSFEYYPRYLELGNILKEKYGDRLVDFETKYTVHLGGDRLSAFDKVRAYRKSLSGKSDMSDAEFDLVTQSGWFNKEEASYWKALEFAKERHAGQKRDEGTPYFEHITGVIEILLKCGKITDYIFTIAALHDVLEDTETTKDELYTLLRKHPAEETIATFRHLYECDQSEAEELYDRLNNGDCRDIIAEVELLTHKEEDAFKEYIDRIFQYDSIKRERYCYNGAAIVKLADRLHNLTTLLLCGKTEKIHKKIRETEDYIMPWRDKHKNCEVLFAQIEAKLEELKSTEREGVLL